MTNHSITTIIDKHLNKWIEKGVNILPGKIEPEMANPNDPMNDEGWQKWYPIDSTVTDAEIEELETQLKFRLPSDYKIFLKHKYFYELYIYEARFSGHIIRRWKHQLIDKAFDGYPREFLIDKGYIPFADWNDWGQLCFDTNNQKTANEYPVVLWDHERWDEFEPYSDNFESLLVKLDKLSESDGGD